MKYLFFFFVLIFAMACRKTKDVPATASFTVIHAMPTGNPIAPKFGSTGGYYMTTDFSPPLLNIYYGSSQLYSLVAGVNPLLIVPFTDTTFKIFDGSLTLASGGIYSLFLAGDTAHADTLFVKDNIPSYSDSSAGLRFVNLTVDAKPVTINLQSDPSHMEFPVLAYKQITEFKKYSAAASIGGVYTFEIRDQATGELLTTYSWYYPLYYNNTIVISGSTVPASSTPLNVFSVNNY